MSLLSDIKVGSINLKNRIALAPLTRSRAVGGIPNDIMKKYYVDRANAGLLISEACHISPDAVGWVDCPGIYTEEQVHEWKKITDAVHEAGGKIVVQLWHQGRQSHYDFFDGEKPVAPSAILCKGNITTPLGHKKFSEPRALEVDEIESIIKDYAESAKLAMEAGFDGVEIHAANGYLPDQFIQKCSNNRDDHYGGSFENRYRFCKEVIHAVKEAIGADKTGIRLGPNGIYGDMGSEDNREMFTYVFEEVAKEDLAYCHVIDGFFGGGFHGFGEPYKLSEVKDIFKKVQGENPYTVIMGNCGYTFETAEKAIENNYGEMIAFGTAFMANPDLVEKYKNGVKWEDLNENYHHKYWYKPGFGEEGYNYPPKMEPEEPENEPEQS